MNTPTQVQQGTSLPERKRRTGRRPRGLVGPLPEERNGLEHLTQWEPAKWTLDSQFGRVEYSKWCALEAQRMQRRGVRVRVAHDSAGFCAIVKG